MAGTASRACQRALVGLCLLTVAALPAGAAEHRDEAAGACYLPDDLPRQTVVPVVIVEHGLAQGEGQVWTELSERLQVVVVETASIRGKLGRESSDGDVRAAVTRALAFAQQHHDVARCPWTVVAFSAAGGPLARLALRGKPGRFQGLFLANSTEAAERLAVRKDRQGPRVWVVHSRRDRVAPVERAREVAASLKQGGLDVTLRELPTDEHMAPVAAPGAPLLVKLLETIGTDPVDRGRADGPPKAGYRQVETKAADGLELTADVYETGQPTDPVLLLFHQARSSRGEYRRIAPRLVAAGYNCVALDQRSGGEWRGVPNLTARRAAEQDLPREYADARPDLDRAVLWARELGFIGNLGVVGSSYSSSLVVFLGADEEGIDAVVSFSPGDYLPPAGAIFAAAKRLTCPTLIVAPPAEQRQASEVFEPVAAKDKELYVQPDGVHGASTLVWSKSADLAWTRLLGFLSRSLK